MHCRWGATEEGDDDDSSPTFRPLKTGEFFKMTSLVFFTSANPPTGIFRVHERTKQRTEHTQQHPTHPGDNVDDDNDD